MKFPNHGDAFVDVAKLRDYCLSPDHPRGKHKARVFEAKLGLVQADAAELGQIIHAGVSRAECVEGETDGYGERFFADIEVSREGRSAVIRTAWIMLHGEGSPRLTTCFVL